MKDQQLVDTLKAISSIHRSQFDQRRRIEWRVFVSTLGVYAAIIGASLTGDVELPHACWFRCATWIALLGLSLIAIFGLRAMNKANETNKRFAHVAENVLMRLSGEQEFAEVRASIPAFPGFRWSLTWQAVVLVLFAVAASLTVTTS
jgi:hypothetical protein